MTSTSVFVSSAGGRGVQRSVDDGAALGEDLAPVGEELRVVVLPGAVRLQAGSNVNMHGRWSLRCRGLRLLRRWLGRRLLRHDSRAQGHRPERDCQSKNPHVPSS